ncbi:hypothetical protein AAG906_036801 [Vitis piasezkii]
MDQQSVTVDQFTAAMASIQEALTNLRQEMGVHTIVPEDTHARMDRIKQCIRQLRVSNSSVVWDDLNSILVANLPTKFKMLEIERVPFTDFGYLVLALYDVEDSISRGLWYDSSLVDAKGKKPIGGRGQMWALLLLLVKDLPGIISQFHNLLGLILLIHFSSIGHEYLLDHMIRLTHLPH